MNILITGASGFLGKHILHKLGDSHQFTATILRKLEDTQTIDFSRIDAIIHSAALVHQMQGASEQAYQYSNCDLTVALAQSAKQSGVKKFIFISTVKVYGENPQGVLDCTTACVPQDPYGESKFRAEKALLDLQDDAFTVCILRLPLVYGAEVKGNFINLLAMHAHKKIIPFKNVTTKRSMVYVGNVTAMIDKLIGYNGDMSIFVISDALEPIKLNQLSSCLITHFRRANSIWFISFPSVAKSLLKHIKPSFYQRLFGDFIIDPSVSFKALNFTPPFTTDQGLQHTVEWYLSTQQGS